MQLSGIVGNIIYKNNDTGYTVLNLELPKGEVCVVGIMPLVGEGEQIEVEGDYMMHQTYGSQFVVSSFTSRLPVEETTILRYLSSGIVKGIRAKTARLLLDKYGSETLEMLENYPERLASEIKGMSIGRATKISDDMREMRGVKEILLYFQRFGISPTIAFKIFKQWGMRSYEIINENPYRLCEIRGIGFEKADDVAFKMDYDKGSENRVQAGIVYVLNHNLYNGGHTFLPREKLVQVSSAILEAEEDVVKKNIEILIENKTLAFEEKISNTNGVYLRWVYEAENNIARRIVLSSKFYHDYDGDFERDIIKVENALGISFAENQRLAIKEACCHNIMVLTGGPGTGKTTTLNGIINIFERKGLTFAIAAPTGRAAKRVTELSGKESKTIHRLLEYSNQGGEQVFLRNRENPLEQDVIIIDESSMIDLWLFDRLLEAVRVNSTIILVGDANQLPPVGPGSVFKDIIGSDAVAIIALNKIFRQAEESLIITNAHKIISGNSPELTDRKRDFFFLPAPNGESTGELVTQLYSQRLPSAYGFDPLSDIQIICPSKKGLTGTINLNNMLKEAVNPPAFSKKEIKFKERNFREGDKVMQIRNNYDAVFEKDNGEVETGIFNGDIGVIEKVYEKDDCLTVRFDDKVVTYTPEMLDDLDLAFAVTVHKSQGSEFNCVILPLLDGPDVLFTRNLLYTAVTRAKKLIILTGSAQKIASMVQNNYTDKRYCGLKFKIWEMME